MRKKKRMGDMGTMKLNTPRLGVSLWGQVEGPDVVVGNSEEERLRLSAEEAIGLLSMLKHHLHEHYMQLDSINQARFDGTRTVNRFRGILCNSVEHSGAVELLFDNECSLLLPYDVARGLKSYLISGTWTFEREEMEHE